MRWGVSGRALATCWFGAMAVAALGCGGGREVSPGVAGPEAPERVVSLDYCADQYVLGFVDRERIAGLSPDSEAGFSYLRERARGLPQVRPNAEEVLARRPDLVVRSYGGGPGAAAFYRRAGVRVAQLGFADDLAGVREVLLRAASDLGVPARGEALAAEFDARLAAVGVSVGARVAGRSGGGGRPTALYLTPGGVSAGPGTLVHELLAAAGYDNFLAEPGFREIPLERLARERPDRLVPAFYDAPEAHAGHWSAARHPLVRALFAEGPTTALSGAWTACGGWFLLDAVEALAAAGNGTESSASGRGSPAMPPEASR